MYGFHSAYLDFSFLQELKWQTRKKSLQKITQTRDQVHILTRIDLATDLLPQVEDQDLITAKDLIRDLQLSQVNQTRVDLVQDLLNLLLHTDLDQDLW